jgi:hypothetical protein
MEDYLPMPIIDDASIRNWAQQIRRMKINELERLIEVNQESLDRIRSMEPIDLGIAFSKMFCEGMVVKEISKLKQKLWILIK